jgi:hypothetical protein
MGSTATVVGGARRTGVVGTSGGLTLGTAAHRARLSTSRSLFAPETLLALRWAAPLPDCLGRLGRPCGRFAGLVQGRSCQVAYEAESAGAGRRPWGGAKARVVLVIFRSKRHGPGPWHQVSPVRAISLRGAR